MNLKEALKQLADIREEIKLLNKKIKKLEPKSQETVCDVVDSTTKSPVMLCHTKIYGQDARIQKRIETYRNILSTRYNKLLEMQIELEKFIDQLPTRRIRRIFTYRYIDQLSWIKIANLMGQNATVDSIRKEHDRILQKNKHCPFCPEKK